MNETKNKIDELYKQIRELKEQLKKEKSNQGIPYKEGSWSVMGHGYIGIPMDKQEEFDKVLNRFASAESAQKHSEMMTTWRQGLVDKNSGNPIDIEVILPFLKKGWVAMDKNGKWYWFKDKPSIVEKRLIWGANNTNFERIQCFNLKYAPDWRYSLKKCG